MYYSETFLHMTYNLDRMCSCVLLVIVIVLKVIEIILAIVIILKDF